jgi:Domain of unknown function (DUF3883)
MAPPNEAGLVLVQNDRTAGGKYDDWEDVLGERYHFPNQYKNKVRRGTPFVYYRGVRRSEGRRGQPEYFGCGYIGDVWRDARISEAEPKVQWKWYCTIDDYVPFANPVPAKSNGVAAFEEIPENFWGVGVRTIAYERLHRILREAGAQETRTTPNPSGEPTLSSPVMPAIESVAPSVVDRLDALLAPSSGPRDNDRGGATRSAGPRRTRFSKLIGDRAEEVVMRMLLHQGVKGLRWLAREGLTPGWDIEFVGDDGELVAVEVKGTSGDAFTSFDVTAAEWEMARQMRGRFRIVLVARCLSDSPVVFWLKDPLEGAERNSICVVPAVWRITLGVVGPRDVAR